jgi:2-methylisocitrate lyase-like PEP mutase family enzyme
VAIMTTREQQAHLFASLHQSGNPLLLPNAWDAASAAVIAAAGASAIATTSAGVAWSLGRADGGGMTADLLAAAIGRIASTVDIPVSADIEAGYDDVAETVSKVVQAGAIGINIEDRRDRSGLFSAPEQAARIAAARAAAAEAGIPIWINARTDVWLGGSRQLAEALDRAEHYKKAGADSLFVPGLVDTKEIAEIVAGPLPVAVMVWSGAPSVAELTAAGAVRISLGAAIAEAAYAKAAEAAHEMLTQGTYDVTATGLPYPKLNTLFS